MAAKKAASRKKPQIPFAYKLVLNQWLLSLFGVKRFEDLAGICVTRSWKAWTRTISTISTMRSLLNSST